MRLLATINRRAAAAALVLGTLTATQAAIVTFDYTAAGGGASIVGTFGWDDSVVDSRAAPNIGQYDASGFLTVNITGGAQDGLALHLTGLTWEVYDGPADTLQILFSPVFISIDDFDGTALTSQALPTQLDLSQFENRPLLVAVAGNNGSYALTSVTLRPAVPAGVPEPASGALLLPAALAAYAARRSALARR